MAKQNGIDVKAINPRNGEKYSPNLYKWLTLRTMAYRKHISRVYGAEDGTLWIGYIEDGELFGSRLISVLCNGSKEQTACWVNLGHLVEVADFWPRYVADGRCAIDQNHNMLFVGDESRWKVDGDTRHCQWCGKATQVLKKWTETVERQKWEMQ